jgi:hypothetical protein
LNFAGSFTESASCRCWDLISSSTVSAESRRDQPAPEGDGAALAEFAGAAIAGVDDFAIVGRGPTSFWRASGKNASSMLLENFGGRARRGGDSAPMAAQTARKKR